MSFTTISSTGPNAAIIHYSPDPEDCSVIDINQSKIPIYFVNQADTAIKVYLCDSGGQYTDGTTDVTRTLHFGKPTDDEINAYTRVLQGHIAIDMFQMPVMATGTNGYRLDSLARQYLWEDGLDYRHGSQYSVL